MTNFCNLTGSRIVFLSLTLLKEMLTELAIVNFWAENSPSFLQLTLELKLETVFSNEDQNRKYHYHSCQLAQITNMKDNQTGIHG